MVSSEAVFWRERKAWWTLIAFPSTADSTENETPSFEFTSASVPAGKAPRKINVKGSSDADQI